MSPDPRVRALERRVADLARRTPTPGLGNPTASTAFGAAFGRPYQVGFPAELTGPFDAQTGYPWKRLVLDYAGAEVAAVTPTETGEGAFTPDNDETLVAGQRGWMELDPGAGGYLFLPAGVVGVGVGGSLLCEVTVTDTGSGHTVKRKTWDAGLVAIADSAGPVTYAPCRSTTGDAYPVGWYVYLDPIPDVSGEYWISPAPQYAASTKAGLVSATTQTISGAKTLEKPLVVNSLTDGGNALVVSDNFASACTIWSDTAYSDPTDRTVTFFSGTSYGLVEVIGAVKVAEMTGSTVPVSYAYYEPVYNSGVTGASNRRTLAYRDPEVSPITSRCVYTPVRQKYYIQVADNSSGTGAAWREVFIEDGHIATTVAVPSSA